jgi:hypothetical protein
MRLVLEGECPEHKIMGCIYWGHNGQYHRIIDPDNLPDEWIDAAAEAIFEVGPDREFETYARAALSAALHIDQENP